MADLRERFAELREEIDRLPDPDLAPPHLSRGPIRPRAGRPLQRLATAVLALVVATISTVLVVRAFSGSDRRVPIDAPAPTTFDPQVAFTVPVSPNGQTNAIVAAADSIWVTAYGVEGGAGRDRSVVFQLDATTGRVVRTIPILALPSWEVGGYGVTAGFGSVWIAGGGSLDRGYETILERIDPVNGAIVATIPLGGSGGGADVDVNDEGVWVTIRAGEADELVLVDPVTNSIVDRISLPQRYARVVIATEGIVIAEELVWIGDRGPCSVLTSIDPATHAIVARSDPFPEPYCSTTRLVEWRGVAWGTTNDYRLIPIDAETALPVGEGFAFEPKHGPRSFLLPSDTGIWYAAYPGGNGVRPDRLTRIDPTTGERTTYPLEVGAIAAVMDGDSIWTLSFDGEVTRIDLNPR